MIKIFISYRHVDSKDRTHRIADKLSNIYGDDAVFIDIYDIAGGEDFAKVISKNLKASDVMLVIIGDKWVSEFKRRATKDDKDYVQTEVAFGLEYFSLVIPVLMDKSLSIPKKNLPSDIAPICEKNFAYVRGGRDFETDMKHLEKTIDKSVRKKELALNEEKGCRNLLINLNPIAQGIIAIATVIGVFLAFITLLYLAGILRPIEPKPATTEAPIVTETPSAPINGSLTATETPGPTLTLSPTFTPNATATFDRFTVVLNPPDSTWFPDTHNLAYCYSSDATFGNISMATQESLEVPPRPSSPCVGILMDADVNAQLANIRFLDTQTQCLIGKPYAACDVTLYSSVLSPYDMRPVGIGTPTPNPQSTLDAMMDRVSQP